MRSVCCTLSNYTSKIKSGFAHERNVPWCFGAVKITKFAIDLHLFMVQTETSWRCTWPEGSQQKVHPVLGLLDAPTEDYGLKYVPPETEFESFIFEYELLNLNNCIKN